MTVRTRLQRRRLLRDTSGLAAIELALGLPMLLTVGLMGLELTNRAIVQMQVNQLAVHVADNASRIGDQSQLENRRIYEGDIQDLFFGAEVQAGANLDLYGRGRVVISSLEVVPDSEPEEQYIHWQRCMGRKNIASSFGLEGAGLSGAFPGMGPAGEEVIAFADEAVMFVEIFYDYDPLIGNPFGASTTIHSTASFTVRDDRDLSQIYQRDPGHPDTEADCDSFTTTSFSASSGGSSSSSTSGGSTTTSSSSTTSGGSTSSSTTTSSTTTSSSSTSGGTWGSSGRGGGRGGGGGGRGGSGGRG